MEQIEERICLTCGQSDTGNYCSECGERLKPRRISWDDLFSDYWNDTFAFDTPFLSSVKNLIKRPGHFVNDYVKGTRAQFSRPFHFYLLLLALNYLVIVYLVDIDQVLDQAQLMEAGVTAEQMEGINTFYQTMQDYTKVLIFMQLPFLAFFSWLFYRKSGHNYLENFVFVLFTGAIMLIMGMIPGIFSSLLPMSVYTPIAAIFNIGSIVYFLWALYQFKGQKTAGGFFKTIGVYVSAVFVYSCLVMAFTYYLFRDQLEGVF